ncbi:hypothetical protein P6F26_06955 [Roseibacterium sp. SDUM158017]|uniref:hypothetical protein n=1 Tax=Roseicyclus salinarum TaxID=3036773 RepID=UPI002414DBCD|nr:hypothetical protein [Roseibacterium sp. SDUM158017]MDG4648177.1 hypothetical protein [Roseibacterium sp. SDUM158017]
MQHLFSLDMPFLRFARNTLIVSLAALVPLLALFVSLRPGFAGMLLEGGPALWLFLRQVLTNGLPVVFAVNWVGFVLYASREARDGTRDAALAIPVDIALRLAVFVALHGVIYVLSARWFGSFGGDPATALSVVAPTLARSAFLENISGVYLHATLVSALPLYVSAIRRSVRLAPLARRFPGRSGPTVLALAAFAAFVALLTVSAGWVTSIQGAG